MATRLCALAVACLVGSAAWAETETMRVHFIDVGQGDAALIEFPCATMLIDTGGETTTWKKGRIQKVYGGSNAAIGYLQGFFNAKGVKDPRLDLLVLTHPHIDHTNGAPQIMRQFRPKNLVYNGQDRGSGIEEQDAAEEFASDHDDIQKWFVLEHTIPDGEGLTNPTIDPIACDSVDPKILALWGKAKDDGQWHSKELRDGNNNSVVIRIDFGEASILFTGDLEESEKNRKAGIEHLLEKYEGSSLLDVDVYQVGHHGSANGNSDALAKAISPEIAVLSHGPECEIRKGFSAFRHGHPREETIEELLSCEVNGQPCLADREPKGVQVFDGERRCRPRERCWESKVISKAIYSTGWDGTIVLEANTDGEWTVASLSGVDECLFD